MKLYQRVVVSFGRSSSGASESKLSEFRCDPTLPIGTFLPRGLCLELRRELSQFAYRRIRPQRALEVFARRRCFPAQAAPRQRTRFCPYADLAVRGAD